MVEVNCTLTSKETSSYIHTVSLDNTRDGGAQRLTDNLVPYTNYTAECLVFKDGVDQCYIGSDTTQTYTDSEYYSIYTTSIYVYVHMYWKHHVLCIPHIYTWHLKSTSWDVPHNAKMHITVSLYVPFSLSVRTHCTSSKIVPCTHLLPLLHNDVGPSSQGAAEWWDSELWSGVQRGGQQQYSGEHNTRHEVHCRGSDTWQSVPVQSSSKHSEWNGTILRVDCTWDHTNR